MISKKDLLKETGISYGQLYRWKRENLIPEEWFVKQSSYTGQETFFPREKILSRIRAIQNLKDRYSLEELSKILSPEISQRKFLTEDLNSIEEIDKALIDIFADSFNKISFNYIDVIIIVGFSQFKKEFYEVDQNQLTKMINGIKEYCEKLKSTNYILLIFNKSKDYYAGICSSSSEFYLDSSLELIKIIRLEDISNMIKMKYSFTHEFSSKLFDN